jgi:hypothetical protein
MLRKYVSKVLEINNGASYGKRLLRGWFDKSASKAWLGSERRFFDPREELTYKSNQAKSRMHARFHQSF